MSASYFICILTAIALMLPIRIRKMNICFPKNSTIIGTAALCFIITSLFALKTTIVDAASHSLTNPPPYINLLPLRTITNNTYENEIPAHLSEALESVSIMQTTALFMLAFVLREKISRKKTRYIVNVIIAATSLVLLTTALHATSIESEDIYIYAGLAEVTPTPYHPGSTPLPGDNAVINRMWGNPLIPSVYGPLWIILSKAVTVPLATLAQKLFALRCLEAAALIVCVLSLCLLRLPFWAIALFTVNPTIYDLFISEGHNDLMGTAFVLCASVVRRKTLLGAILLTAAAGMIKLPFIIIGSFVFASELTPFRRIVPILASAATSLALSFIAAGPWYAWAVRYVLHAYAPLGGLDAFLRGVLIAVAIAAVSFAVACGKFTPGAAWSMAAFAPFFNAWYLAWSLPYALLSTQPNLIFLATLPIAAYLLTTGNAMTSYFMLLRFVCIVVPTCLIIAALLRRRSKSPP